MRKRLISVLCILALSASLLPVGGLIALAEEPDLSETHWEVRFVLNGGAWHDGTTDDLVEWVPKSPTNSRLARLPESPRREGYAFGGWFNEPELLTRFQFMASTGTGTNANFNQINRDRVLYAAWAEKAEVVQWELKYHTNFDEPLNEPEEWTLDDYSFQDDYIWSQNGIGFYERHLRRTTPANAAAADELGLIPDWYRGNRAQFGAGGGTTAWSFYDELASITEWRKAHTYGEDNWLTLQQYGQGLPGADGPGNPYGGKGGSFVAENGRVALLTNSHTDSGTITNSNPLPPYYRLEVMVHNIEVGGRAIDPITGREPPITSQIVMADWITPRGFNGYQNVPVPTTSTSSLWNLPPTHASYRSAGPWDSTNAASGIGKNAVAENGIYFLGILDYPNVRPNNNLHIHHHRKVIFDSDDNYALKSAGTGSAGWSQVWTGSAFQGDGSRYMTMLWCIPNMNDINAMNYSSWHQWFSIGTPYFSYTQVGSQYGSVRMTDKYMPGESYLFVVERTPEYYMLSTTGNWYHAGEYTYEWTKFHLPNNDPRDPKFNHNQYTWHYNQTPEELAGLIPPMHASMLADGGKVYFRDQEGETHTFEPWATESGYPDFFVLGIPHVNYYDGYAEFSDFKLYINADYLYELDVSAVPGGRVTGTPAGLYNAVESVSLGVETDPFYVFAGWTFEQVNAGLALDPSSTALSFTMPTEDVRLVANFEEVLSATPRAAVDKLNGNQNRLHIWIDIVRQDGSTFSEYAVFMINNNAAGTYKVGVYSVYVDTKGNDQIRACYIVD